MAKKVADHHERYKIGGHIYRIQQDPRLIAASGLWAQCNHIDKIFRVDGTINNREFLGAVIHETFEAVKSNRELDLPHSVLQNIEDAVLSVLVDNADLYVDVLQNLD
jgi:hypothetical protein